MTPSNFNRKDNYERRSHTHCWNQDGQPPCGIPLEKHSQCCLCDTPFPPSQAGWSERFDKDFPEEEMEYEDESYSDVVIAPSLRLKLFISQELKAERQRTIDWAKKHAQSGAHYPPMITLEDLLQELEDR